MVWNHIVAQIYIYMYVCNTYTYIIYIYIGIWYSAQTIIFHQPRFPWNKKISLPQLPFGVRSCEVAIIWPDTCILNIEIQQLPVKTAKNFVVCLPIAVKKKNGSRGTSSAGLSCLETWWRSERLVLLPIRLVGSSRWRFWRFFGIVSRSFGGNTHWATCLFAGKPLTLVTFYGF